MEGHVFIERHWRSLEYECVYTALLRGWTASTSEIADWFRYYNEERPHVSLAWEDPTPMEAYTPSRGA